MTGDRGERDAEVALDPAGGAVEVGACAGPDGDEQVESQPGGVPARVCMPARRVRTEFGHRAEHSNRAPAVAARGERLERGRHRERIRVIGVVDQQTPVRQRLLLAAPGRELDRCRALGDPVDRQAERGVARDGGGHRTSAVASSPKRHSSRSLRR